MQPKNSLKSKTISGMFWSFSDLIVNQGIQFIILIILARILLPEHFGLIGMIMIFIAISNSIVDSGFTQALIREQKATQADYSTIFYFNIVLSILIYAILYLFAPLISKFFGEPELISILRVLSLVIIINSYGIVQRALLIKEVNFKLQTKINMIAGVTSGIISISIAVIGFGVWSLVVSTITLQFTQVVLLWLFNKWKPSWTFNIFSLKKLFGFGWKLMVVGIIDTVFRNIYLVIIGKYYSASQLGYYTNAMKLQTVASHSITAAVQRVTYPVFSSIQEDNERLKNNYRKIIKISSFINFPFMIGLAAISDPLINLVFGEKWMPMVIYFQLLCFAGMLYPLHAINLNILQVKGRSDIFLWIEIAKKIILSILIAIVMWFDLGIIYLISSVVLHSFICLFINSFFSGREISYSFIVQIIDVLPMFMLSMCMGVIVYCSGVLMPNNTLLKLVSQILIGLLVYFSLSRAFKLKELIIIMEILLTYFRKKLN